jgi:hypothetical protein
MLCFAWQPTEHTSEVAGNWIGSWSQQFAEHRVLYAKIHYGTWGCHSGTLRAMLQVLYTKVQVVGLGLRTGTLLWLI